MAGQWRVVVSWWRRVVKADKGGGLEGCGYGGTEYGEAPWDNCMHAASQNYLCLVIMVTFELNCPHVVSHNATPFFPNG